MNKIHVEWLAKKREEVRRMWANHGNEVYLWDAPQFVQLIDALQREIRKLRTQLGRKP